VSKAILSVENLAVEFETSLGHVPALRGVSFELNSGEILGIVGESGSGKTVACRSILRLLPHTARTRSGRIMYDEKDLLRIELQELASIRGERIAMIFQDPSTHLDPLMTAGGQIGEALGFHFGTKPDQRRAQSIDLLHDVRIQDPERRVDAYPHELSGGMRQRVMIAAALACEPEILIADEPTTALDVTVQAQILALLKQLRMERNLSIILVSHDLGIIGETCDRVVIMKNGLVVETGSTTDILRKPRKEYTKLLLSSQPDLLRRELIDLKDRKDKDLASQDNSGKPILEITDLSVHFKKSPGFIGWLRRQEGHVVKAVDNVSIRVRQGESLGIVGESGSGKSTIARAVVRILNIESGRIYFKGQEITKSNETSLRTFRRAVQMVFQDPYTSLNPRLTVAQTLAEPLRIYNICKSSEIAERVRSLMNDVELPEDFMHRRPAQLSGGQRQRIGIARALSLNPEVIIADEVTSSLDVTIQAQILALFNKLRRRRNLTIIFISHNLSVVRNICETVLVMKQGQLVEYGRTQQIFKAPQKDYTRELLDAIPRVFHA
jgi:peptide/nickel transport system ATP-binding protein